MICEAWMSLWWQNAGASSCHLFFKWQLLCKTTWIAQYGCEYIDVAACQLWCPHRRLFTFLQENPLTPEDQSGGKEGGGEDSPPSPGDYPHCQMRGSRASMWPKMIHLEPSSGRLFNIGKTSMQSCCCWMSFCYHKWQTSPRTITNIQRKAELREPEKQGPGAWTNQAPRSSSHCTFQLREAINSLYC